MKKTLGLLAVIALSLSPIHVAAFPVSIDQVTKPLTKKQLRIAVMLIVAERLQQLDLTTPLQLQLGNASRLLIPIITRKLP